MPAIDGFELTGLLLERRPGAARGDAHLGGRLGGGAAGARSGRARVPVQGRSRRARRAARRPGPLREASTPTTTRSALAGLVAAGEVTAAELLDAARTPRAGGQPAINAIVRWIEEPPAAAPDGPFAGVPFLLKDLAQDVAGIPTSNGSRSLRDVPAQRTSVVRSDSWPPACRCSARPTPPSSAPRASPSPRCSARAATPGTPGTRPADPRAGRRRRWPPASSRWREPATAAARSGIPAACCGLFGLKVGRGLIPSGPAVGEALHGSGVQGVVSRSVRDSAAMLDVLSGPDRTSPRTQPARHRTAPLPRPTVRCRAGATPARSASAQRSPARGGARSGARRATEALEALGPSRHRARRAPATTRTSCRATSSRAGSSTRPRWWSASSS